jgi:hypothetical protein
MNIEEYVEVWIKRSELNFVLGFAGQDIRPLMQFVIITRTLTNYLSSLRLNLDTLQSLYRVGCRYSSLFDLVLKAIFSEFPPEIGEPFTDIEADFKRVILPGIAFVFYGNPLTKRRQELPTGSTLPSSHTSHQRRHLRAF